MGHSGILLQSQHLILALKGRVQQEIGLHRNVETTLYYTTKYILKRKDEKKKRKEGKYFMECMMTGWLS